MNAPGTTMRRSMPSARRHGTINPGTATHELTRVSRRSFLSSSALALTHGLVHAQQRGERPHRDPRAEVVNPRARVPISLIIDDSTCLVNLNKFAIPQFAEVFPERYGQYRWREWPSEIPDSFVRRFGEWAAENGVKGKYSVVPFPACVGRLDRTLPGWTQKELRDSIDLVRTLLMPSWDIHPEMVTHTRIVDTRTGHPYEELSPRFMENWDWPTGRSTDEIADYISYALTILKNVGLPCGGITTPGGFGSTARPQLAEATFQACRDIFKTDVPHYFRDVFDHGDQSVAPLVQNARGLDGPDPQCVVHIIGCTGDWTGGWDCTPPKGADRFITADGASGRLVEVIRRGEPAILVCHWTGIYFNGEEVGFKILQEVVRRLHASCDNLHWMKNGEIARYWAAKELTAIGADPDGRGVAFGAPFACDEFTIRVNAAVTRPPRLATAGGEVPLREVATLARLEPGAWHRKGGRATACFPLPKGRSRLIW